MQLKLPYIKVCFQNNKPKRINKAARKRPKKKKHKLQASRQKKTKAIEKKAMKCYNLIATRKF